MSGAGGDIPSPVIGRGVYDRGNGPSSSSEQTGRLLVTAGAAVGRLMAERLDLRGSSPHQQSVLLTLADLGPHGRTDLAERTGIPPAGLAAVVDGLLVRDLVRVLVVNVGGRQEVLAITDSGAAALEAVRDDMDGVQELLLASLTRGERAQLHYLLRRVCAAAARTAAAPA